MTSAKSARRPHHWRRDLIELAALFTAVAVADAIANLIGHQPDGPYLLMASAVALVATAAFHTWWARRHSHAPPSDEEGGAVGAAGEAGNSGTGELTGAEEAGAEETVLWRMRTTVRDAPGSLAALCVALSGLRVDILTLQTHPLAQGTVDEFLLRAPVSLPAQELSREIAAAGGASTWIERADAHDLVDTPTRVLSLATRTALDAAELPLALRQLLGRCTIHSLPAVSVTGRATGQSAPVEGVLEETVMRLRDPSGGVIVVERPYLPFTPTEFARARALVELDARLGPRVPRSEDVLTLPEGNEITVRRADRGDLAAARAMHDRCSQRTLGLRYHGPVKDADRYLDHLLSPRFGRTLAVQTASGKLVALGHLLWDGDETEVALLVEDDWQRRGIGSELLGRLVALAVEAGCDSVYAVTQSHNTGMVAAMRALELPLDYQIEEGTLVITARLTTEGAARPSAPAEQARR
ncbi:N-acetyltransferase family protein [Streptomyces griseus]|uniref:GNAT family N-acetyltransferase n=2 Tax=Streptomyces TaxID=1883 RepID=A0AB33KNS1_9ACTN|nr:MULTISPECIES: GNAT family N-acetyltransferase [unclassified Streptomyces]WSV25898.1 GNAT family N-acetyltransferase [Streptomyces fimicarius]WTC92355.1 GNAT family N-acetyltransferase [Streptomyces griseus]MDX3341643.1 GNAT family N-acetyltransferase [Streptomyces sp. ME02-6979.5a]MDX3504585.1 GNAT family N-acetyltransferase [Streptomyces sp. ATCC51928]MDX5524259.1 GNAT family N-acetyltransferase [Streptomyces sp. DE06-01C]